MTNNVTPHVIKNATTVSSNESKVIKGIVMSDGDYKRRKVFTVMFGVRKYHVISESTSFLESGDKLAFIPSATMTPTNGAYMNIRLYELGDNYHIEIDYSHEGTYRAALESPTFMRDGGSVKPALLEAEASAVFLNMTLQQYMDQYSYEYSAEKFYDWWLRSRINRRLWHLKLNTTNIDELCAYYQCKVGGLYALIRENPMHAAPIDIKDAEKLCSEFRIAVSPEERERAMIARFIYTNLIKKRHTYMTLAAIQKQHPHIAKYRKELERDYMMRFYTFTRVGGNPLPIVQFTYVLEAEIYVADFVQTMLDKPRRQISDIICSDEVRADSYQYEALCTILQENISMLVAPPGRGKTRIITEVYRNYVARGEKCIIIAYTGKAVERVRDVVGVDNKVAMTIDYLIHKGRAIRGGKRLIDDDDDSPCLKSLGHVIMDESSMTSTATMYEFLSCYRDLISSFTIIGDNNQLQPTTWGTFMQQLILSEVVPICKLHTNYRDKNGAYSQTSTGYIAETNNCKFYGGNHDTVVAHYRSLIDSGIDHHNIIIITPRNEDVGIINIMAQEARSAADAARPLVVKISTASVEDSDSSELYIDANAPTSVTDASGNIFNVGDKVILKQNLKDERYKNGAIGDITRVSKTHNRVVVKFKKGELAFTLSKLTNEKEYKNYSRRNITPTTDVLRLAYCLTVHAAEGDEWAHVLLYIAAPLVDRNIELTVEFFNFYLINTAASRVREHLAIFGDRKFLDKYFKLAPPARNETLTARLRTTITE